MPLAALARKNCAWIFRSLSPAQAAKITQTLSSMVLMLSALAWGCASVLRTFVIANFIVVA
jgi:hypothetical protein